MKMPFYTVLGPLLRPRCRTFNALCRSKFLQFSSYYVPLLGLMGTICNVLDVVSIIRCGPSYRLPCHLVQMQPREPLVFQIHIERDLKLLGLFLSIQCYVALILSVWTENAVFLMPFLLLNVCIIPVECLTLLLILYKDGFLLIHRIRTSLLLYLLYNFLSVLCVFFRMVPTSDFF